ncbi:serpin A3-8 [Fopius arisanus]|uniref:SERPINA3-8 protein n=1 Tax=Fopius arisanus TaxID=64838 RepID=A0A0C9S0B3_9HYME|nr:PREDICTED: serpin A3-8-like [Fopius arisanus]
MKLVFLMLAFLALHNYTRAQIVFPGQVSQRRNQYASTQSLKNRINKFTMSLFKNILEKESGNFVTSPLSAYLVLAMTAYGAKGTTRDELLQVLDLPYDKESAKSLLHVINSVKRYSTESLLRVENRIFAKPHLSLNRYYQALLQGVFQSSVQTVDFGNPSEAVNIINAWCRRATFGFIDKIVDDTIDPTTALLLANSVLFQGKWKIPFSSRDTYLRPFKVNDTITKDVPTMIHEEDVLIGKLPHLKATFIGLPYKDGDKPEETIHMYAILPDRPEYLTITERNIGRLTLADLQNAKLFEREIRLPKVKISKNLKLRDYLMAMGIKQAFSKDADFNGMFNNARKLSISDLVQKTLLKVDEEGTIAAAVAWAPLTNKIGSLPLVFDRPFLVVIATNDVILFAGKVTDPSVSE